MKRTMMAVGFCGIIAICGCVSQSAYDSLVKENKDLCERVARIERDLYKVEEKSAATIKVAPKFVPAPKVEESVLDAKINSFLKEYVGAQFGDSIEKFPDPTTGRRRNDSRCRKIHVLKKFQYFDSAYGVFIDGKLYEIRFYVDVDKKYSVDSMNQRINQTLADIAVTLGLDSDALIKDREHWVSRWCWIGKQNGEDSPAGYRRRGVTFHNSLVYRDADMKMRARKNAEGEELPAAE